MKIVNMLSITAALMLSTSALANEKSSFESNDTLKKCERNISMSVVIKGKETWRQGQIRVLKNWQKRVNKEFGYAYTDWRLAKDRKLVCRPRHSGQIRACWAAAKPCAK